METLGPYQLIRRIAIGGMAEIFLAQQPSSTGASPYIVIKRILPHRAGDAEFVDMFLNEARLAAMLTHPNIVRIYDLGGKDGVFFIAMEYVQGYDLGQILDRSQEKGEFIPPFIVAKMIGQTALGLHHAHTYKDPTTNQPLDLIHRDVSLPNVMLSLDGVIKVLDFGIAKASRNEQSYQTQAGVLKGKISYMSPEYLMGNEIDWRHDLFALGVMMYELLTGQKPFDAKGDVQMLQAILTQEPRNPHQFNPSIPNVLVDIMMKLLAKERELRYQTGLKLHEDLVEASLQHNGYDITNEQLAQYIRELFKGAPNEVHPISPVSTSPSKQQPIAPTTDLPHFQADASFPSDAQISAIFQKSHSPSIENSNSFQSPPPSQQSSSNLYTSAPSSVQSSWDSETRCLDISDIKDGLDPLHTPEPTPTAALILNPDGSIQTGRMEEIVHNYPAAPPPSTPHPSQLEATTELSEEEDLDSTQEPIPPEALEQFSSEHENDEPSSTPIDTPSSSNPPLYLFILVAVILLILIALSGFLYLRLRQQKKLLASEQQRAQKAQLLKQAQRRMTTSSQKRLPPPPPPKKQIDMLGARVIIRATSPPCPCTVYWLNKKRRLGRTPLHIRLPAGRHRLLLSRRRPRVYYPFSINPKNGQLYKRYIRINEGLLILKITPWAKVYIDGNYLGRTPIQPQRFYTGYHKLKLISPSGRVYHRRFFIRNHRRHLIKMKLH